MRIGKINKAIFLTLFFLVLSLFDGWASFQMTGVVRDKKSKEAVAGAFVLAYSGNVQKGFAYSGEDGHFSIKVQDGVHIDALRVSMMGYAPANVETGGRTSGILIELTPQAMRINPSSVKSNPIRRKGDTLSYYVQAFSDGTERVLEDLIGKIPGLATTEQGTILFEGESINRFYVEDLDLMGSKYGVVTKNLKASDIARVDVYLNHQPVQALQDINPTEKSAVNIVLKENAKGTWMFTGDALIGFPPFPRFDAKAMVSRFAKTRQSLFLLKGNNLGSDISQELRDQPGINDRAGVYLLDGNIENEYSSPLTPSGARLPIPKEYWFDNLSGIASFNHLVKTGDNAKLRLALNAAAERFTEQTFSSETVNFEDGTVLGIEDTKTHASRKYYFQGQASYEDNGPRRYILESLAFSGQLRKDLSDGAGRNNYTENYNLPSFKAENNLRLTLRLGEKALDISSTAAFVRNHHTATFDTGERSYYQSYLQNEFTSSHGVSFAVAAGRHSFSADASVGLDYIGLHTDLTPSADIPGLRVPLQDMLSVFSASPSLTLRDVINLGKVSVTASFPVSLHVLDVRGKNGIVYPSLKPSLTLRYTPTAHLTATAGVSYSMYRSSPETLLDAVVMHNYRTLSCADSLRQSRRLAANASLRYSNPVDMLFLTLRGTVGRMMNDKSTSRTYEPDLTVRGYVPFANATFMYNVDGDARKYFGGKSLMLGASLGYRESEADEYLQDRPIHNVTRTVSAGGIVRTNPVDWFSARLQVDYVRQASLNGRSEIISHILTGVGAVRFSPLRKLDIDVEGYLRRDQIPNVTVFNRPLLKAVISWRLAKATAYIECNNLLDIREYRQETVDTYRTVSMVNHLCGRQFLAGIRMSL